jgi:hypothetical protein
MTTMDAEGEGKNKSPEECKGMVRSGGGGSMPMARHGKTFET